MFSGEEVADCTQTLKLNSAAAHNLIFGFAGSCVLILWPKFNSYTFFSLKSFVILLIKEKIIQMWHFYYLSDWKKQEIQSYFYCVFTYSRLKMQTIL